MLGGVPVHPTSPHLAVISESSRSPVMPVDRVIANRILSNNNVLQLPTRRVMYRLYRTIKPTPNTSHSVKDVQRFPQRAPE
jgi:hypothetical protein